jgi:ribonuclease VapC
MPATLVLDSFALIGYFRGEAAAVRVRELLGEAAAKERHLHMTEVNYAEVKYQILRKEGAAAWAEAASLLVSLPIEFHSVNRTLADRAADLEARHKLSLADAFAAALAMDRKAGLVTGDPEFKALEKEIRIIWLK